MKQWIHFIFILFVIPFGFTQQIHVNLSVDQKDLEVGTPIIITVTSNVKGDITIDFPPNFTSLPGVQSGMNQQMDYHSGKTETVYFISRTGAFHDVGRYSFRAKLKSGKKIHYSNAVNVRVNEKAVVKTIISRKDVKKPVFGVIEVDKKTIYEGESVLVNGKVYTKYELALEFYEPYKITGYPDIKEIASAKETVLIPVVVNGQQYFQTPFDKKVLFFSAPGKYEVGPFKMGVQYEASDEYVSYEVKSSKEIIEVLPLPPNAPENFIGAIGNYNFTRNFDLQEVKQGDVVVMTVVVEGEGNIHNISVPQFELPDGVIQYGDPEITESISYKQIGAKGRKVYKFHLQFLEKGNFTIPQMEISFFNPNEKKYVLLKSEAVAVHVLKSAQFQNQILDNSEGLITKLDSNNADNSDERKGETSTFSLVLLGVFVPIGLGAFLFFFIKRKPKKEIEKTVETMEEMKEVEHITILLEESNHFQLKGDYKVSFEQLETAIRMMVMFATEYLEDLPNRESINQELSELSVACETARFLEVYDAEKVRNVYSKANLIFKSLKQQMI